MNDNLLIDALRNEQQLARPEFSPKLHARLTTALDREEGRLRRRRIAVAIPLAACLALVAAFAARDVQTTSDQHETLASAEPLTTLPSATAGVEILLQRSDRAAAELRERMDLPKWSLDRALDSSKLTRAVFNRLPLGGPIEPRTKHDDSDPKTAQQPPAPA